MKSNLVNQSNLSNIAFYIDGTQNVSYGLLFSKIHRAMDRVYKGSLVFLLAGNNLPSVVFYLACLEKGAVPLLLAEDISRSSLQNLTKIYKPNFLFKRITDIDNTSDVQILWKEGGYGLFQSDINFFHDLHPDLSLLLATSGSTGSIKLVRLSFKNLISNAKSISQYLKITPAEIAITSLPFNYSYGLSIINTHLLSGASVVLTERSLLDAEFWKLVNEFQVTSLAGVPYHYDMLIKLRLERLKMPTVKTLTQAGGRLDPIKVKKVADFCLENNMRFFLMYGQTEATARISYMPPEDLLERPSSIGRAIPNGLLRIEGADGRLVDTPGLIGELIYEGPNVSMGYAQCLDDLKLGDVFKGVLRTGDLASFDEAGYFYIDGRVQRFLKIFGLRISLDSVEGILTDRGIEGVAHGRDDLLSISVVSLSIDDCRELKLFLANTLGLHHSGIRVQAVSKLPRLANGKVDYQCLNQSI